VAVAKYLAQFEELESLVLICDRELCSLPVLTLLALLGQKYNY
jgi:hypothetical protein